MIWREVVTSSTGTDQLPRSGQGTVWTYSVIDYIRAMTSNVTVMEFLSLVTVCHRMADGAAAAGSHSYAGHFRQGVICRDYPASIYKYTPVGYL